MTIPDAVVRLSEPTERVNPYPTYASLRAHQPVHWSEGAGAFLFTRYRDCEFILRNAEAFPSGIGGAGGPSEVKLPPGESLRFLLRTHISLNPPEHTRMRRLLSRAFTARRVQALRPGIEAIADRLVGAVTARLAAGDVVDLHDALSVPLPLNVIAELMGVPEADRPRLSVLVPDFMCVFDPAATPDDLRRADEAVFAMYDYYDVLVAERRLDPRGDLVSALVAANEEDRMRDEELRTQLLTVWAAGFETTANALDHAMLVLLRDPGLARWLETEHGMKAFVDETLRFESVAQIAPGLRYAARDAVVSGVRIPAGSPVRLLLGAANRDPEVYPDPDRFDPGRSGPPSLAFGHGVHLCLGAGLARMELEVVLTRLPPMRLAGPRPPVPRGVFPMRDYAGIPVIAA